MQDPATVGYPTCSPRPSCSRLRHDGRSACRNRHERRRENSPV
jgi:hypothetical protein